MTLATCGGSNDRGPAAGARGQPATRAERTPKSVIKAWADALRRGDVAKATSYFGLPAVVQNGTPPLRLRSRADVRAFNESLPCGARLLRTYSSGRYTTAVFRLTERPGPGVCGQGTGLTARTTFAVRDGKIREWRRVPDNPRPTGPVV